MSGSAWHKGKGRGVGADAKRRGEASYLPPDAEDPAKQVDGHETGVHSETEDTTEEVLLDPAETDTKDEPDDEVAYPPEARADDGAAGTGLDWEMGSEPGAQAWTWAVEEHEAASSEDDDADPYGVDSRDDGFMGAQANLMNDAEQDGAGEHGADADRAWEEDGAGAPGREGSWVAKEPYQREAAAEHPETQEREAAEEEENLPAPGIEEEEHATRETASEKAHQEPGTSDASYQDASASKTVVETYEPESEQGHSVRVWRESEHVGEVAGGEEPLDEERGGAEEPWGSVAEHLEAAQNKEDKEDDARGMPDEDGGEANSSAEENKSERSARREKRRAPEVQQMLFDPSELAYSRREKNKDPARPRLRYAPRAVKAAAAVLYASGALSVALAAYWLLGFTGDAAPVTHLLAAPTSWYVLAASGVLSIAAGVSAGRGSAPALWTLLAVAAASSFASYPPLLLPLGAAAIACAAGGEARRWII